MSNRGYIVKEGFNVDALDQDVVKQVQQGGGWDENDQARYDAAIKKKNSAPTAGRNPFNTPDSDDERVWTPEHPDRPGAPKPGHNLDKREKMDIGRPSFPNDPNKGLPKPKRGEAKQRAQAFQNQQVKQDNDINTNITGDNNKVFNNQDNSIRQYGGDNRKLVVNEGGGGKGKSPYYTAADKAMTYATMSGFYDADDSPAAQASFVDQQQTMNRDAQKRYANVGAETAAKYAGTRGGDVNIKALQSRLDKNHNYFFDLATIQGVKTYGDRDAITKYPKFEFGDPIKPVESNAGKIADKYRDDIDDM